METVITCGKSTIPTITSPLRSTSILKITESEEEKGWEQEKEVKERTEMK